MLLTRLIFLFYTLSLSLFLSLSLSLFLFLFLSLSLSPSLGVCVGLCKVIFLMPRKVVQKQTLTQVNHREDGEAAVEVDAPRSRLGLRV